MTDLIEIHSLLTKLSTAESGSRELDYQLALVTGWTRHVENVPDSNGATRERVLWMMPGASNVTAKVPKYTSSIQAGYQLAEAVAPGQNGGCGWEPGCASAKIGNWPAVESSTPELALCIAALKIIAATSLRAR